MATTTEKYTTLGETTVAATYTAGSGTLVVASGALFPATPNFHVRLFNPSRTVLKVTAVAGTTWTVVAEANDVNTPIGTLVVLIMSAQSMDAIRADLQQLTTFAAANAAEKAGIIQRYTDSPLVARDNGAGFDYSVHGWPIIPLDQSAWNDFGAPVSAVQSLGSVTLTGAVSGGTQLRGRLRGSYPTPPFTLIVGVRPMWQGAGNVVQLACIGLTTSDGTKHKVFVIANFNFNNANPPDAAWVGKYNSATAAVSASVVPGISDVIQSVMWLRLIDDNVNQTFDFSFNKKTWLRVLQEGRTTFLTPSDIGIVMTNQGGAPSFDQGGDIVSWELS